MITMLVLLLLGAALGLGGLFGLLVIADWWDTRADRKLGAIRAERQQHEAAVMKLTQDAIQQMLNIARHSR
jgi:hypothetical protein